MAYFITIIFYTIGLIVIHQIFIYRLLGAIINVIGGYNYESMINFLKETYWDYIWFKLCINLGIAIFVLFPLCLRKEERIMENLSDVGFYTLLYVFLAILVQFPFYFINYWREEYKEKEEKTHINVYNVKSGFTKQVKFFQTLGIFFFFFSGNTDIFPILEKADKKYSGKNIILSIIFEGLIYLFICPY